MEDTAPEPVLIKHLINLAVDAQALDSILTARSVEGAGGRFKPAAMALSIGAQAIDRAARAAALVFEAPPEGARRGRFIVTDKGTIFWPLDPKPEECDLDSIALSLCQKVRWTGLMVGAYTVGEHSIRVGRVAHVLGIIEKLKVEMLDLLEAFSIGHDFHEAYLPDMSSPLADFFSGWSEIKSNVQRAIDEYLGLPHMPAELEQLVHTADIIVRVLEAESGYPNFNPRAIEGWSLPQVADLVPAAYVFDVINAASMSTSWPRSVVKAMLVAHMSKLREAKLARDAAIAATPPELVPNAGLREGDPTAQVRAHRWKDVTETVEEPVDLEDQLRKAEAKSAQAQASKKAKG